MGEVTAVTDQTFEAEVKQAEGPVLVDFWAEWCLPCRKLSPVVAELAEEYRGRLKVCKLDVDGNPEVAGAHGIQSIPTLLLFKQGEVVDRQVGAGSKEALKSWIEKNL